MNFVMDAPKNKHYMQIWNFLKKHKVIIGSIWAFLTTCLSIYWGIYPINHNPKLTIYEKSKIDAFTLEKPIDELQIFVNGRNIEKDNLNLKVYRFKLINNGERDIRNVDYSNISDFGLKILNGKCIRLNLDSTNDEELKESIFNKYSEDSSIVFFNKIFIPQGHYIMFDIWLVHQKEAKPEISVVGKIADTEIELTAQEEDNKNGFDALLGFVVAILIAGIIVLPFYLLIWIFSFMQTTFRKITLKNKLSHYYNKSNTIHRIFLDFYKSVGIKEFKHIMNSLLDTEARNIFYTEETNNKKLIEKAKVELVDIVDAKIGDYESDFLLIIDELEKAGLLVKKDNTILINDKLINEIKLFLRLL